MKTTTIVVIALLSLLLLVAGCNTTTSTEQVAVANTAESGASTSSQPHNVFLDSNVAPGTVSLRVGDSVQWTNNNADALTLHFADGDVTVGKSATKTFNTAGDFRYTLKESNLEGNVLVK